MIAILLIVIAALQYRLWVGEGSLAEVTRLEGEIHRQQTENDQLRERNRILAVEVDNLKNGLDSIEERARNDIGMIRKGETFFMVIKESR